MAKKRQCCDWHQGYAGHPCEVCDDKCRCAWIFGDFGEDKQILCYQHYQEMKGISTEKVKKVI
jgi:hypothetical protein